VIILILTSIHPLLFLCMVFVHCSFIWSSVTLKSSAHDLFLHFILSFWEELDGRNQKSRGTMRPYAPNPVSAPKPDPVGPFCLSLGSVQVPFTLPYRN
jgi:hypothetical protein